MKKIATKILIYLTLLSCTLFVIYYAKGYRINLDDNTVIQTGILHIETQPNRANYHITEELKGRTPKIITPILPGSHEINIWLEDYHDMKYNIEILPERSTPLSVFLFKKNPEEKLIETIEKDVIETHISDSRNTAIMLLAQGQEYEIIKYQTNTRFWQRSGNPTTVFDFLLEKDNKIENFSVSPNSKNVLIEISGEETTEDSLEPGKYLVSLDTQTILTNINEVEEEIRWAHDGESIFWQDEEGIKKLNLKDPKNPRLLYETEEGIDLIFYDTYTNGELFILYQNQDESFVRLSKIVKNEEIPLIEEIYYQTENRFLNDWKEKEFVEYTPFSNSPQSTIFVGKPTEFLISHGNSNIIFNTEFASYIYETLEDRYVLINPYKTEILSFSPDGFKIMFLNLEKNELGFFTFDRETGNESVKLGGTYVLKDIQKNTCDDFAWHQNSQNIYYACNSLLYVADIRNKDVLTLVENFGKHILFETDRKVVSLKQGQNSLEIIEIEM